MHSGAINEFNDDTVHMNYLHDGNYQLQNRWFLETRSETFTIRQWLNAFDPAAPGIYNWEDASLPKNWMMQGFQGREHKSVNTPV
jgi:hypothetical protein